VDRGEGSGALIHFELAVGFSRRYPVVAAIADASAAKTLRRPP
jgi:hypothetical protein